MEKRKVIFKVLNAKDEELRQITVEVEFGKKFKKRAEDEALKQIGEGEKIQLVVSEKEKEPDQPKNGHRSTVRYRKFDDQKIRRGFGEIEITVAVEGDPSFDKIFQREVLKVLPKGWTAEIKNVTPITE